MTEGKGAGGRWWAGDDLQPVLSPDGQQLAADIADPKASNVDVWTFDLRAGTSRRFTFGALEETTPVWAPDGGRIAYGSSDTGMEVKTTSGFEEERILAQRPATRSRWEEASSALTPGLQMANTLSHH